MTQLTTLAYSLILVFSLTACQKNPSVKNIRKNTGTPGERTVPQGESKPKDSAPPPVSTPQATILEGVWESNPSLIDGYVRRMTITNDVLVYESFNSIDDTDYYRLDFIFAINEKLGPLGYMTHEIFYIDENGNFYEPEVFRIDTTPPSVVIGASEQEYIRYHKK